jgi:hypothetical protein
MYFVLQFVGFQAAINLLFSAMPFFNYFNTLGRELNQQIIWPAPAPNAQRSRLYARPRVR